MTKQSEQVAHNELVGAGQTSLHSHAGGGGADVKGGHVANITCGSYADVTFTTAFASTPSVAATGDVTAAKEHTVMISNVSVNGFRINVSKDHTGGGCSTVGVYWIATDAGNP